MKDDKELDGYSDSVLDEWYEGEDDEADIEQPAAIEAEPAEEPSSPAATDETVPGEEVQTEDPAPAGNATGTPPAAPSVPDPNDWIESLDPEVRKQAEALVRRASSDAGRVAATQRRLDEANAELEARRIAGVKVRRKASDNAKTEEVDPSLKEFAEEFPTVHDNIQRMNAAERKAIRDELMEEIRPIKEERVKQHLVQERDRLRQGFNQLFNTHETGLQLEDVLTSNEWKTWLDIQPPEYQQFVRTSKTSDAALKALDDFARYEEAIVYQEWVDAGMPGDEVPVQPNDADRIAAQRGAALQGAAPDSRSAAVSDSKNAASYDAYFEEAVGAG